MQWLLNEFKKFRESVQKDLDIAVSKWAQEQIACAEELKRLRGEITAMKARMGKQPKQQAQDEGIRASSPH